MKKVLLLTAVLGAMSNMAQEAQADEGILDWLQGGHISGDIRLYDFSRDYAGTASDQSAGSPYTGAGTFNFKDMNALSLGGKLKGETGDWNGFSAGAAWYYAWDIGANNYTYNDNKLYNAAYGYPYLNSLLMGVNRTVDLLGEAWLQYHNSVFTVRGGRIAIDNPWVNSSDGFMIPNLYQGGSLLVTPMPGLSFNVDRVTDYKNRTTTDFSQSTIAALPYDKLIYTGESGGTLDAGVNWQDAHVTAHAWLYDFYDLAHMVYLEGGYHDFPGVHPLFINAQYVDESGSGAIGNVDAQVLGFKLGINLDRELGNVFVAWNRAASSTVTAISAGAPTTAYNGNLYSPYTQIYNTDPLYTTVMNYGLVSARAPGDAWMLGACLHLDGGQVDVVPTVSEYDTEPHVANARAWMLDVAWHVPGKLRGLTLRERLGVEQNIPLLGSSYLDNRIMLQYAF